MKETPRIDQLLELVAEIENLRKAQDLLQTVWLNDKCQIPVEIRYRIDDYFGLNQNE